MPAKVIVNDDIAQKMRAMYEAGASCREVGIAFGFRNKGTARNVLLEAGAVMDRSRSISIKKMGQPSPLKGRPKPPEQVEKMRQSRLGKPGKKGHVFTAESRARMRETRLRLIDANPEILARLHEAAAARPRMPVQEVSRRTKQRGAYKRLVRRLLTGGKRGRSADILGYTRDQFVEHIENQFEPGMEWEPDVHVDHIVPVAAFFDFGISEPRVVNALCNLRPLTASANRAKSDKYPRENFDSDLALIISTIGLTAVSDNGRTIYKQGIK